MLLRMKDDANISIIIPVYNEEKYIGRCLKSLNNQTLMPNQIIVVDDGSTDATLNIVSEFDVKIVKRSVNGERNVDRIPYVLMDGSRFLRNLGFVGVLDADTVLEKRYYEKLTQKFSDDNKLGIASGKLTNQPDCGHILGLIPYVFGCNRLYSRKCWMKINDGKIMKIVPSWDTFHNLYARKFGYHPKRFEDVESWALRPARTSTPFQKGYCSFQLGYYPWFLLLRSLRGFSPGILAGYLKAFCMEEQQYPVKSYVQHVQINRVKRVLNRI